MTADSKVLHTHLLVLILCVCVYNQSVCTLISASSKLLQLQCLWRSRDSAQVSTLTWALASYTCMSESAAPPVHHLKGSDFLY